VRTRTRTIIKKTYPAIPSSNTPYTNTNCSGVNTSGSYTEGLTAGFNSHYVEERIDDHLGMGISHNVRHRRKEVVHTEQIPAVVGWPLGSPFGKQIYNAAFAVRIPGLLKYIVESNLAPWVVTANRTDTSAPSRWTLVAPTTNESVLKENCFERARMLKADVLLNIVESNQIVPAIRSLVTVFDLPDRGYSWREVRKVLRSASGAFLAWKFGIGPIISDMLSIHKFIPKIRDALRRHTEQADIRASSASIGNAVFNDSETNVAFLNGYKCSRGSYQGRVLVKPTVRYVLVVRPRIKYDNELFKKLDFFVSRFATSPADLAWEKVPFSFVVDWFVDLRGVLRAIDKSIGFNPFEIKSFTRSYTYKLEADGFYDHYNSCNGDNILAAKVGTVTCSHYERSVVTDSVNLPVLLPRFGKNQAAISAALITQKLSSLGSKRPALLRASKL
jgi:hypothetical protein